MILKSIEEISKIRESALVVSKTLGMLAGEIKPGITSLFLDNLAETFILDNLCKPGFKGYNGFPNTLCISINEQVVHGIPNNNPLKEGDIISIDCGVIKDGFYGDHAYTFKVGNVEKEVENLLEITKRSLYIGIESLIPGNNVGDIGNSIQNFISKHGYGIVRELVGHGLGKTPEMIWVKSRDTSGNANPWQVYHRGIGNNKKLYLYFFLLLKLPLPFFGFTIFNLYFFVYRFLTTGFFLL